MILDIPWADIMWPIVGAVDVAYTFSLPSDPPSRASGYHNDKSNGQEYRN